jgi:hypothetical protein
MSTDNLNFDDLNCIDNDKHNFKIETCKILLIKLILNTAI